MKKAAQAKAKCASRQLSAAQGIVRAAGLLIRENRGGTPMFMFEWSSRGRRYRIASYWPTCSKLIVSLKKAPGTHQAGDLLLAAEKVLEAVKSPKLPVSEPVSQIDREYRAIMAGSSDNCPFDV